MIQALQPELSVEQLAEQIRQEATRAQRTEDFDELFARLPALTLPPSRYAPPDSVGDALARAKGKTTVKQSVPKVFHGLLRNQGGFNGIVLTAIESVFRSCQDLHHQIGQMTGHMQAQTVWLNLLMQARQADRTTIQTLEALVEQASARAAAQEAVNHRLRAEFNALHAVVHSNVARVERMEQAGDETRTRLDQVHAQIGNEHAEWKSAITGRLNRAEEEVRGHQAPLDEHTGELREMRAEIKRLAEQARETERRVAEQMEQMRTNVNEASLSQAHSDRIAGCERGINEHRSWLEGGEVRLRDLARQDVELRDWLKNLQASADRGGPLAERVQGCEQRLEAGDGRFQDLARQDIELRDWLQNLQASADRGGPLAERVQGCEQRLDEQKTWLAGDGERLRRLAEQDMDLRHRLEMLDSRLNGTEPERAALRGQLEQHAGSLAALRKDLGRVDDRQTAAEGYWKGQFALQHRFIHSLRQGDGDQAARSDNLNLESAAAAHDEESAGQFYLDFENLFRGTRETVKERVAVYLPHLAAVNGGSASRPVLDLGCGRGEWLELLGANGLHGSGVDLNSAMVEECRSRGLDVKAGDALRHLAALADASVGAVTAFHLIEHLPFPVLTALLREAYRVLQPGGVAIFETPNPNNILVGAATFYQDPTHLRPCPPNSTKFLAEHAGFSNVTVLELHPFPDQAMIHPPDSEVARRFNAYFYGPQDYALLAFR